MHSHLRLIETAESSELLINAHMYLIKISTVDDREVFKICLEYWGKVSCTDDDKETIRESQLT
jgi:exportin-1